MKKNQLNSLREQIQEDILSYPEANLFRSYFRCRAALSVVCAIALLGAAEAPAALITWSAAQTVSSDSDVDTTGSLVYAFTFGGTNAPPSTIVNGVTFSPFTIPGGIVSTVTVGNVTLSESPGNLFGSNSFGSASTPFSSLSSNYQSLLGTGAYADLPTTITVSLNGLTSGQNYLVQWWTSDSALLAPIYGGFFTSTTATSGTNSVTLDANTSNTGGGLGQFATGTFIASGTNQSFALVETSGGYNPLINALQVREAVAVPEPSTWVMGLALIACGVWGTLRRKRAR
ncbi:MAG: PEP-CTERM sorting domain-containing protein [Akkermansiaceae bacterium]